VAREARPEASRTAQEGGDDLNVRILQPLALFLRERRGLATLERATTAAGLRACDLDGRSHWVSLEQCEAFLVQARSAFPEARVERPVVAPPLPALSNIAAGRLGRA